MGPSVRSGVSSRAGTRLGGIRASTARHTSVLGPSRGLAADRAGAASPADSISTSGTKRKERDFDSEVGGEETNINVVVRCRGRNQREIKENSTVVVNADGVKGKLVELSMGANALSNKTYNFDRVFSQAADQNMVFDDTVKPILDEVGLPHSPSRTRRELSAADPWPDACGLQLYHLRVRPDRHRKDVYHVWRYD